MSFFISDKLYSYLMEFEGYRNNVYKDTEGYLTVGVGHKLTAIECKKYTEGFFLNDEKIQELYISDIDNAINMAKKVFKTFNNQNGNIQLFLILMCFNLGGRIKTFRNANQQLEQFNFGLARKDYLDSLWAEQVKEHRATKTTNLLLNIVD